MPRPDAQDPRPFAGVEVVEFGQFIAVPYCAQLLADGGAHVVKIESLDDPQVLANRMVHDLPHPAVGTIRVAATPMRMDGPGFVTSPATPPYGSEVREILGALGFSAEEVEGLVRDGVTRTSYPAR